MPARTVDLFDDVGIFVESHEVTLVKSGTPPTDRDYEREALRMAVEYGVVPAQLLSKLRATVRTAGTTKAMVRLCRSLAFDIESDSDIGLENGPGVLLDTS